MQNITLTADQLKVKKAFTQFLLDPAKSEMVIEGYAGTGKTTIVHTLVEELPNILKTAHLLSNTKQADLPTDTYFTATTNKAAAAFSDLTGKEVTTIHSFLGLRVQRDFSKNTSRLVCKNKGQKISNVILFIDEASYIDLELLSWIKNIVVNSKVIFIGDPAQLTPIKSAYARVFSEGFTTASLTEVVRQAKGNPIIDLATAFRNTVNSGQFFKFVPDGHYIKLMNRNDFDQALLTEFSDPKWTSQKSKLLAWTNRTVVNYNHLINDKVKGTPSLEKHDYAVCNAYINNGISKISTDQLVQVTHIHPDSMFDVPGWYVELDGHFSAFLPQDYTDRARTLKKFVNAGDYKYVNRIEKSWVDLRAAYACTINKSQGSTYDRVFIDLDDVAKCNNAKTIARMLYVAVSRARHQVILTGDLV